ncbi:hypothetical protein W97_03350 [Coniosporium apollinis CBS 100218]|uniref:Uncharacterized protein n=1 Tax=Coniosporium apollinis (strain CBS 100218) TaxID=1168221 RepID=R7YQE0_CONA1|nr:uncharacterized protein W97_03350 [Coniosporium apollinis CBS 100218]EON64120.1 hypothetical protein W97_03350 [Coniosporium apollinis CBS 100218]
MTLEPKLQGEETHRAEQKVAEEAQPTEEVQRVEAARQAAIVPAPLKIWPAGTVKCWWEYDAGEDKTAAALTVKYLAYFLEHDLSEDTIEALHQDIPDSTFQAKAARHTDNKLACKWQGAILTNYVLFLATRIREKKLAESPPVEMLHLTPAERKKIYEDEWNKKPLQLVRRMWSPFTETIDFYHIFNTCEHNG